MNREEIFGRVSKHRDAMDEFYGPNTLSITPALALPILIEEVGEVATALLTHDGSNLKDELFDVLQVCVAWLEGM